MLLIELCNLLESEEIWEIELPFDSEGSNAAIQREAFKFAKKFNCTAQLIQHDGPSGGASEFNFIGKKQNLMDLCREYEGSNDDDFFNEYAQKSSSSKKPKQDKLPSDNYVKYLNNLLKGISFIWSPKRVLGTDTYLATDKKYTVTSVRQKKAFGNNFDIYVSGLRDGDLNGHPYGLQDYGFLANIRKVLPKGSHIEYSEQGLQGKTYINVDIYIPGIIEN